MGNKKKWQNNQQSTISMPPGQMTSVSLDNVGKARWFSLATIWHYATTFGRWVWTLLEISAILGVIGFYYQFSPNLSVLLSPAYFSSDPFAIPFTISNNGYWTFRNVQAVCDLNKIEARGENGGKLIIDNSSVLTEHGVADVLQPGDALSVRCRPLAMKGASLKEADISLLVTFRLFGYGKQERLFRFIASESSDGNSHWLPQPIGK